MEIRNEKFVVKWSLYPHKCKTGLFTSWKERERLRKCTKMELLFFNVKYANLWRHCRPRRRGCLTTSYKYTPSPNNEAVVFAAFHGNYKEIYLNENLHYHNHQFHNNSDSPWYIPGTILNTISCSVLSGLKLKQKQVLFQGGEMKGHREELAKPVRGEHRSWAKCNS